jgi:hypothetical protein
MRQIGQDVKESGFTAAADKISPFGWLSCTHQRTKKPGRCVFSRDFSHRPDYDKGKTFFVGNL